MASRDSENNMKNFANAAECLSDDQAERDSINDIQLDNLTESTDSTTQDHLDDEDQLTIDQIIERIGFGKFQVKLMFLVGLAWMADGCEMMLLSILGPTLKCVWFLSSLQEALITTTVFVGQMLGSGLWGWASDKYGRTRCIILSTICVIYFGILSSRSPTYAWIMAIRLLVGFGIGGAPQA
eukprot:Seg834.4 transcript_id=Seg834.4/GoldUCD/mRNA.D3Y31 product="Synaptic vesicle 2-related protein" protein_id=Seg834.4/GoldUCD/D3Y31